jgi:molecular chaperone GrpE
VTDKKAPNLHVTDKRARARKGEDASGEPLVEAPDAGVVETQSELEHDYLNDLKRLQADFDNYRKRMMRQQAEVSARAGARIIERLLPVLDSFERALEHAPDDEGLVQVQKELMTALQAEGLSLIDALGNRFDPHFHEAVESREDPDVTEPTVEEVYRSGYTLGSKVIRPAMVVVSRPVDKEPDVREEEQVP